MIRSVVVITSALQARNPGFKPQRQITFNGWQRMVVKDGGRLKQLLCTYRLLAFISLFLPPVYARSLTPPFCSLNNI